MERTPVRQTTGGTSRCSSPNVRGSVRRTPAGSVKPRTVSPGAVTNRWAAMSVGSGARTATVSRLPSSSQVKRYSRPRPDLACSNCSILARASASPSGK
uniref:hypothetical protein n=1 Tax=Streptomyces apricus TaxID=1828112 RepID=UPI00165FE977